MQWFVHLLFMLIYVPVASIVACMPYVTRKSESFGVSIPAAAFGDAEIKALRRRYVWQTGVWAALLLVGYMLLAITTQENEKLWEYLFAGMLLLLLAGSFVIYLFKHVQMKRLKQEKDWNATKSHVLIIDTTFRQQRLAYSNGWFLIPLGITVATGLLSLVYYDAIPEQLPLQYDMSGGVTRIAEKSLGTVMMMPAIQLFLIGVFVLVNTIISTAKQQVQVEHPEHSIQQNIIFRRRWSLFTIVMGTALVFLLSFAQLTITNQLSHEYAPIFIVIIVGGIVLGAIVMSFSMGQGGSRVHVNARRQNTGEVNHDDDQFWKLGQFYFNRNDPSLFVEKRFGIGWTINFARPLAWGILLGILGLALGLLWLLS